MHFTLKDMTKTEWRRKRVEQGLCSKCGRVRDRKGWYCSDCLANERERSRKNRDFLKALKICPYCGKNKLWGAERRCLECHAKLKSQWNNLTDEKKREYEEENSRQKKIRYDKRSDEGICTRCGKRKAEYGRKKCRLCLDRDALNHRNARKRKLETVS